MAQFQKEFEKMRLQHRADIEKKDSQIQKIHNEMDKLRYHPQTKEFIKETLEINTQFSKQQEIFCQKISLINAYCETSNALANQVVDQRLEYEEVNKMILEFISWQESE